MASRGSGPGPARRLRGFTLIEILVVVAIIALLISILLPSLKKARDQAKSAVCLANLSSIAKAEGTYQSTDREWIPGSPLTTGYYWAANYVNANSPPWNPFKPGFNPLVVEWYDYATPLRALMQGPKSIPKAALGTDPNKTRNLLLTQLTSGVFNCPMNPHMAGPYTGSGGSGGPFIQAVSYMTMSTIVRGGPSVYYEGGSSKYRASGSDIGQSDAWDVVPPTSYVPKHGRLGRESMKVFAADGLRFFAGEDSGMPISYTCAPADTKGILTATPPSTRSAANNREYVFAKKYSWRHKNQDTINAAFFDGHAEALSADVSSEDTAARPFTGKGIHPKYFYPSGSVVKDPTKLHADFIAPGSALP
ncbi:MAG: prepilin-type N-terminal cleavage/methylation domain-containing protein [Phycisphaerae bacterium]|nr:prepilin-type N-terminal cleavage/methylation domain-containing protein [Phycisphaerae bacterium]